MDGYLPGGDISRACTHMLLISLLKSTPGLSSDPYRCSYGVSVNEFDVEFD